MKLVEKPRVTAKKAVSKKNECFVENRAKSSTKKRKYEIRASPPTT